MIEKNKKIIRVALWGHLSLWSVFFLGISVYLLTEHAKELEIGTMLLYAVVSFVLLILFGIGFKKLPFKNLEDW